MIYKYKFDTQSRNNLLLAISTSIFLGFAFPPFPLGVLACVGFVPYLILVDKISTFRKFFKYTYFTLFIFTLITLYWVGGFTHLKDPYLMFAGALLYLVEPLILSIPASAYFFVRKKFHFNFSVLAFPFIWVAFEWLYAYGEFAFPWLTAGNTQTYYLEKIQFIELTGVYGLSLWLLTLNSLVYLLVKAQIGEYSLRVRNILLVLIFSLYILPNFYKTTFDSVTISDTEKISIGIIQPNTDPWEKWEGGKSFSGRWLQVQKYFELIRQHINNNIDIIILPETAILLNLPQFSEQFYEFKQFCDSANIAILSGYARVQYYSEDSAPITSSNFKGTNIFYDSFNSILFVESKSHLFQSYDKMRLVPFAERIPYAEKVPFLIEPLRWSVGISNWGLGKDSTIFHYNKTNSKFLAMVCYESIFPEFVSQFVNKGAEFLVFITNDSWWGNTSGARQHQQYAVLRAVENRRWVARCANGGISSFIDPWGNAYDKTQMYEQAYIEHAIQPIGEKTFYSLHGDWLARICAIISVVILFFTIVYSFYRK